MEVIDFKKLKKDLKDFQKKAKKTPLHCKNDVEIILTKIDNLKKDKSILSNEKYLSELNKIEDTLKLFKSNIEAINNIKKGVKKK